MLVTAIVVAACVVFAVTLVTVFLLSGRFRLRYNEIRAWAQSYGWTYAIVEPALTTTFPGTPAARAVGGYARNVVRGRLDGAQAVAFDCMIEREFRDTVDTYVFTAMSVPAPVPALTVGREARTDRVARSLGLRDIEFENEDFNRRYHVQCTDRAFAYDVLNPRFIEWLLATDGPEWQLGGPSLVCWHLGSVHPAVLEADLAYLRGLRAHIPAFIWEKARGSA